MNVKKDSDFFDLNMYVTLLLAAWSRGDDYEIQKVIDLLYAWSKNRQEQKDKAA